MRLHRTALLDQLRLAAEVGATLLEAPAGFGKSWLLRKLATPDSVRLRGRFDVDDAATACATAAPLIIDDAHLLTADAVDRLADHIDQAPDGTRILIAGRLVARELHDNVELVDGQVVDRLALAVTPAELMEELPDVDDDLATKVVDATDGCIRIVRSAFDNAEQQPRANPATIAFAVTRDSATAVLATLDPSDREIVGLLARAPGLDEHLMRRLGGADVVERLLIAGVPMWRDAAGRLNLTTADAYRAAHVGTAAATRLATELVARDRVSAAIGLLIEAGEIDGAAEIVRRQGDSLTDTVEPRELLRLLAGLGRLVELDPELLLVRASTFAALGRFSDTITDIARAGKLAEHATPALRRRVQVEAARARLAEGRIDLAIPAAEQALIDLGADEQRTYARAHEVLAECASTSEARTDLQRAAEEFHTAAAGWEACGEVARARTCRRSLAMGVLISLGRIEESLALLHDLLSAPDLSDAERSWMMLGEAFVLANSGRLDAADDRFVQIAEIGTLQVNPRLKGAAAWGRALVATCRNDLQQTLQWISTAQNTALDPDHDFLGSQFNLDASVMLGALGELDEAERYLQRATHMTSAFPAQTTLARFVLDARRGELGDVEAQLAATAPSQWWRVQLVSAHAAARSGDMERAQQLSGDAYRELLALGFHDAALLGERREQEALRAMLRAEDHREPEAAVPAGRERESGAIRLSVIGPTVTVVSGSEVIALPPGNPQRLVGVTVAQGGSATFDQLSEAIWPGEDVETSRNRLRNVLLRLRKAAGEVLVRTGNGVRMAPGVSCDLDDFNRLARDASSALRADPDLAGHLARRAIDVGEGPLFAEFEYEDWAAEARRTTETKLIELFDLLSIQAEDVGDFAAASRYADGALRFDRYSDSRHRRQADLYVLQGRHAAAAAALESAAAAARELGGDHALGDEDDDLRGFEVPRSRSR